MAVIKMCNLNVVIVINFHFLVHYGLCILTRGEVFSAALGSKVRLQIILTPAKCNWPFSLISFSVIIIMTGKLCVGQNAVVKSKIPRSHTSQFGTL